MNCKPNDLAILVHSVANNHGALYTVMSWAGTRSFKSGNTYHDCWFCRCEQRVVGKLGTVFERGATACVSDAWLRPIRPGDISDEEVRDLYQPKQDEVTA